jgi:trk system potassium uptake protein TrkH
MGQDEDEARVPRGPDTRVDGRATRGPVASHQYAWLNRTPWHEEPVRRRSAVKRTMTPERLLVMSFAGLIAVGTLGFQILPGLYVGEGLSWLDALFTATSAVCVTGLIVVDTATHFTILGQAYVLLLIQLGGLGIITLTTAVILALGRKLSLHHEAVTAATAAVAPEVDLRKLVRSIVTFTLSLEALGAFVLFLTWLPRFPAPLAAWHAVFQSVSAFCNAGFATFSDSLTGFGTSTVSLVTIMALIVLGGIGFVALEDMHVWWTRRRSGARIGLSLHTRLVLTTTLLLIVGGWLAFAVLEWRNTLAPLSPWERTLNALFLSVTARTAGFNTLDHSAMADSTNFVTILLMSIGGSPGSTAGGLKTTTAAAIALLALGRLRGTSVTSAWGRTIPAESIQRAVGLFVMGFVIVTGAILLYAVTHLRPHADTGSLDFLHYMFEAVSAFNTVGLSMGATGSLDPVGKTLTIALMYVGRVGPLAIAAAVSRRREAADSAFRYSYEDVIIG